jgi:Family of unknown function (DUF5995)
MPTRAGSTQHLTEIVQEEVTTIPDVVDRLTQVYGYALDTTTAGQNDGIVCFTQLYRTITEAVYKETYEDLEYLVHLDLEFARRYFRALRSYAADRASAPRPWRLLFDARSDPDIERVQFAAAGVNAHINYDLADALLATWEDFEPNDARRRDFDKINDMFDRHMDGLRQFYDAPFGKAEDDDTVLDRLSNVISSMLVRDTRANAWNDAMQVWDDKDREAARARMLKELEVVASLLGRALLLPIP